MEDIYQEVLDVIQLRKQNESKIEELKSKITDKKVEISAWAKNSLEYDVLSRDEEKLEQQLKELNKQNNDKIAFIQDKLETMIKEERKKLKKNEETNRQQKLDEIDANWTMENWNSFYNEELFDNIKDTGELNGELSNIENESAILVENITKMTNMKRKIVTSKPRELEELEEEINNAMHELQGQQQGQQPQGQQQGQQPQGQQQGQQPQGQQPQGQQQGQQPQGQQPQGQQPQGQQPQGQQPQGQQQGQQPQGQQPQGQQPQGQQPQGQQQGQQPQGQQPQGQQPQGQQQGQQPQGPNLPKCNIRIGRGAIIEYNGQKYEVSKKEMKYAVTINSFSDKELEEYIKTNPDIGCKNESTMDAFKDVVGKGFVDMTVIHSILSTDMSSDKKQEVIRRYVAKAVYANEGKKYDEDMSLEYNMEDLSKGTFLNRILKSEVNAKEKMKICRSAMLAKRRGIAQIRGEYRPKLSERISGWITRKKNMGIKGLFPVRNVDKAHALALEYDNMAYDDDGNKVTKKQLEKAFKDRLKDNKEMEKGDENKLSFRQKRKLKSMVKDYTDEEPER